MTYGSVCSGIESASVAWEHLGWDCAFLSETHPFAREVLKQRWPNAPLHGDFTTIREGDYAPVDLLVAGTPCQSFSIAGARRGLADERGNLTLQYLRLLERLRPKWFLWENVPGVLSDDGGRTLGIILGTVAKLGYGFAYRILDAQFFGVPQRRRRLFLVGHYYDWRRAAAVLFDGQSLLGNSAPSGQTKKTAPPLASRGSLGGGAGTDFDVSPGGLIPTPYTPSSFGLYRKGISPLRSTDGGGAQRYSVVAFHPNGAGTQTTLGATTKILPTLSAAGGAGGKSGEIAIVLPDKEPKSRLNTTYGLRANDGGGPQIAAFQCQGTNVCEMGTLRRGDSVAQGAPFFIARHVVRRFMPVENERLMGFPDGYTAITYKGKPAADGPRNRVLGNAMAIPVMRWIGERLHFVETVYG